jgi:hypothetical protein
MRDAPTELASDEAIAIDNMILDERGGASKRLGCVAVGNLTGQVLSMYIWYHIGFPPAMIVHTNDGKLQYSTNYDSGSPTWTVMGTGKSTTDPYSYETYLGFVYMGNGTDPYAQWDGTTLTEFPAAPRGKFLRLWKDAMWVSGATGTGLAGRVYDSDVGDPTTFGAASWVDIFKGDGDEITALFQDGNSLICFKRRRTFFIYDPVTTANRMVDGEKGCESHFSVIAWEGLIYFFSSIGICAYTGDGPSQVISDKLDPLFDPVFLNYSTLNFVCAYQWGTRVGWAVPEAGQTYPNFQVEYYPRLEKKPFTFHRMPGKFFVTVRKGNSLHLYFAHNSAAKLMEAGIGGLDDGVIFSGMVEIGWYDFGMPINAKYVRSCRISGRGKFEMHWRRNFLSATAATRPVDLTGASSAWGTGLWGQGVWGPDSIVKTDVTQPDVYGYWFLIRFVDAESVAGSRPVDLAGAEYSVIAGQYGIYAVVIEGYMLGDRR